MSNLLTHSRNHSFKTCRRKHWFEYEWGVRKETDPKALRIGIAGHEGLERIGKGEGIAAAVQAARDAYSECPEHIDEHDWRIEEETVVRLLCGYVWRWQDQHLEHLATEQSFRLPLVNPATSRKSQTFELAGKIDGIVRLEDGRVAVLEHKLFSESLDDDSDLWSRLRIDQQLSMYVYAARQLGYEVDTCLYDVIRKPTIKPTDVPILDKLGMKIVLDEHGNRPMTARGQYYQSDAKEGLTLQKRPMTVEEWGEHLNKDIAKRPGFYYARREVPRLDDDMEEFAAELWDVAKTIQEARNHSRWFRTVSPNCKFCSFFYLCSEGWKPTDDLPQGFVRLDDVHPELNLEGQDHGAQSPAPATCSTVESTALGE